MGDEVVGITSFCVHPPHFLKEKQVIGGTKNLNIDKIRELKPDLIICNKEENPKDQVEALACDFEVYVSDVRSPESALQMISEVGALCNKVEAAQSLEDEIKQALKHIEKSKIEGSSLYFIWKDPYMLVSDDTFIQSMIDLTGLRNAITGSNFRYPEFQPSELVSLEADLILLSSEPYSFTAADLHEMANFFPGSIIKLVDGEMISWYGSRMLKGLAYLKNVQDELTLIMKGRKHRDRKSY